MIPEYGLPIMLATDCRVGMHVFVTTGREARHGDYCKCGLATYDETPSYREASNQETRGDA